MDIVALLLPGSLVLALLFVGGYVWALRSGQFDDLDTPSRRMLFDESDSEPPKREQKEQ